MSQTSGLKTKLGLNVFKSGAVPHIKIKQGKEKDPRLKAIMKLCPAGLYTENPGGDFTMTVDGCLECGTCRLVCGTDVLEWTYPEGDTGVQFRAG